MEEGFGHKREGFRGYGGFNRFSSMPKPVAVGDVLEVTIESTGSRGDGIAKKDGFVIFVKGAQQGERVKVKVVSLGRSSATAEVVAGGFAAPAPHDAQTEAPAEVETKGEDIQQ